jgi:hypothetical protein
MITVRNRGYVSSTVPALALPAFPLEKTHEHLALLWIWRAGTLGLRVHEACGRNGIRLALGFCFRNFVRCPAKSKTITVSHMVLSMYFFMLGDTVLNKLLHLVIDPAIVIHEPDEITGNRFILAAYDRSARATTII